MNLVNQISGSAAFRNCIFARGSGAKNGSPSSFLAWRLDLGLLEQGFCFQKTLYLSILSELLNRYELYRVVMSHFSPAYAYSLVNYELAQNRWFIEVH